MSQALAAVPVLPPPDAERAALARTQLLLRLRYYFLAFACLMTVSAAMLRQYRRFSVAMAVVSAAAWVLVWLMARNPRLASALPAPRAETPSQERWRRLRALCVTAALVATMFSAVLAPRLRLYAVALAVVGLLAWVGLLIAERSGRRR